MKPHTSLSFLIAALMFSCGDPIEPQPSPELAHVVKIEGPLDGSAVYLGDGRLLTNWHLAISSAKLGAFESLDPEAFFRHFDASDSSLEAALGGFYCPDPEADALKLSATDEGGCEAIDMTPSQRYSLSFPALGTFLPSRLLYANMDLDLAIIEVDLESAEGADLSTLPSLTLAAQSPARDQSVRVMSYPGGGALTEESCAVTSEATSSLPDPATDFPSVLVVPSFTAECFTVEGGSSGGPVFDDSGQLLGLVWTRAPFGDTLVTAVSGWRAYLADPARETVDTNLERLLSAAMD